MASTPRAPWADAIPSKRDPNRRLPQTIGHRGYKAKYPENTMIAFKGAVQVGAHAIETDVHLTADGVVVLSHDPTGKRCYGVNNKIEDCTYEEISWWRTLQEPHEPMPRLQDLLEWLAEPQNENIWLLLDIKVDDQADELMRAIAKVVTHTPGPRPWDERIVLGCWNASFTIAAREKLPTFPLAHISISPFYSWHFFRVPGMGMNILQRSLIGPVGWTFMRSVKESGRQLFVWTVNEERWMRWCIRRNLRYRRPLDLNSKIGDVQGVEYQGQKLIDGIITDDPRLLREVCDRWEDELDGKLKFSTNHLDRLREGLRAALFSIIVPIGSLIIVVMAIFKGRLNFFKHGDERRLRLSSTR